MGRKKSDKSLKSPGVTFEIEENAKEIFLEHLASSPIPQDQSYDEKAQAKRRSNIARKKLDLHGLRLAEAENFVDRELQGFKQKRQVVEITFITGRGLNSGPGGPVLASGIYQFVVDRYGSFIERIDESPDKLRINDLPIRGYFTARFKFV